MKIVLFLGYGGSGKTRAITQITKALVKARYGKIGTLKRIHDRDFTIDAKGKDTWLHAKAGASVVVALAPEEIDIMRKDLGSSNTSLREIIGIFKSSNIDYLLVEGFHKKFENLNRVKIVVCARSEDEAMGLIKEHPRKIVFITGRFANRSKRKMMAGVPIFYLPRDNMKALDLIGRKN